MIPFRRALWRSLVQPSTKSKVFKVKCVCSGHYPVGSGNLQGWELHNFYDQLVSLLSFFMVKTSPYLPCLNLCLLIPIDPCFSGGPQTVCSILYVI